MRNRRSTDVLAPIVGGAALAARYDGFILDQWGVLHDGVTPYPGALNCLERLREAGKHVVILSNSGKREAENLRVMASMGFESSLFDRFVGAGEDARAALAARRSAFHRALGRRCYAFMRDNDASLLEGLGLDLVADVSHADFLAVVGIDSPRRKAADYDVALQAGVRRGLPMICANPDVVRVSPVGTVDAPGALARRYEALGGRVHFHGKPYPAIYASCLEAMPGCTPDRVVAVGDSIEHDIAGARAAGLASAFVAGGIHAADLVCRWGDMPTMARLSGFLADCGDRPDYVLPAFVW